MPNAGPQLTAKLSLDPAAFEKNLIRVVVMAEQAGKKMTNAHEKAAKKSIAAWRKFTGGALVGGLGKGPLSGLGAGILMGGPTALGASIGAAGRSMVEGVADAYEYARSLEILSRNTGFSTKAMAVFKVAMDDTGISMELFQRTSRMIAKGINLGMHGDQAATAGFEQIGLHVKDLMKLNPEQRFMAVGSAIAEIKDPAMQAAASVSRFGSESAKMLSFFKNKDALAGAASAVGKQAEIFERSGKTMEKIAVRIGHIKVKAMGFFAGVAETIMPMVDKFSAIFDKMDFSSWGAKMGEALNTGVAWLITFFKEPGKTTAYFWESMKAGALGFGNVLVDSAALFGEVLKKSVANAFPDWLKTLSEKFSTGAGMLGAMAAGKSWDNFEFQRSQELAGKGKPVKQGQDHMRAAAQHARADALRPNAAFERARGVMGMNKTPVDLTDTGTSWRFRGFHNDGQLLEKGRHFHSGLQGASMAGYLHRRDRSALTDIDSLSGFHQSAYGQSNLIRHGELNKFRNARVALGLEHRRPGETVSGDRQRAKAVRVELERKQLHAGSSEQLLSDIASYTDEVAKNTRVFVQ